MSETQDKPDLYDDGIRYNPDVDSTLSEEALKRQAEFMERARKITERRED